MADDHPSSDVLENAVWFATVARKNMGFRFGPYTAPELGEIMERCTREGIPLIVTANCGREFDWDLARDWGVGQPADWRPMEEAPTDNVVIMGDVNGIETRIVWWQSWEAWREMKADGMSAGQPVAPRRWRELTPEDAS